VINMDMLIEISLGRVPKMEHIEKYGQTTGLASTSVPAPIWDGDGVWIPPTAPRKHDISSSSTQDKGSLVSTGIITETSRLEIIDETATFSSDGVSAGDAVINDNNHEHSIVTSVESETKLIMLPTRHNKFFNTGDTYRVVTPLGTGASVAHWFGLDSIMGEQEEFVILDGTTSVSTVSDYWRVHRGHIDGAADRDNTNIGVIDATAQTDGTVTARIKEGKGSTLMAIYTVPRGKRALMTAWEGSLNQKGGGTALASLALKEYPFASVGKAGNRLEHVMGLSEAGVNNNRHPFLPFKLFEAETDIMVTVDTVSASNTNITGGFDLILVDH